MSGIEDIIRQTAEAEGAPELADLLIRRARLESSLDPRAQATTSGAAGLFQAVPKTWQEVMPGVPLAARLDPVESTKFGIRYHKQAAAALGSDDEVDTYLGHFLGPAGARRFLSASPETPVTEVVEPRSLAANKRVFFKDGQPRSVGEVYSFYEKKHGRSESSPKESSSPGGTTIEDLLAKEGLLPTQGAEQVDVATEADSPIAKMLKEAGIDTAPLPLEMPKEEAAPSRSWLSDIFQRSWWEGARSRNLVEGLLGAGVDAERVAELSRLAEKVPPPKAVQEMGEAIKQEEHLKALKIIGQNPVTILGTLVVESLIKSAPELLAGIATGAAGGALIGPVGAAAGAGYGALAGIFSGSFNQEVGGKVVELLQESGVDVKDGAAIKTAFEDPAKLGQLREMGLRKGLPIAVIDTLTAALAGLPARALKARGYGLTARAAGEAGLQAGGGMGGEALGETLAGEKLSPIEILLEGIIEVPGAAIEAPLGAMRRRTQVPAAEPEEGVRAAMVDPLGFYSQAEKALEEAPMEKGTGAQWLGFLRNKQGVKKDELEALGLEDFLAGKVGLSKEEVLAFVNDGRLVLEEVKSEDKIDIIGTSMSGEPMEAWPYKGSALKYTDSNLWTPGGQNKREFRLLMPAKQGQKSFRGGHFDEPNVLLHFRTQDFIDAEGKKVLLLDELQSDWHQRGAAKGYRPAPPYKLPEGYFLKDTSRGNWKEFTVVDQEGTIYTSGHTKESAITAFLGVAGPDKVPDAPFKNSWLDLGMKRLLRLAVEGGYDKVAWTTGEQQAERYDLSKHVSAVTYNTAQQHLVAYDLAGNPVINEKAAPPDLAKYIGKEAADKLAKTEKLPGTDVRKLEGLDLKVGGNFLKKVYDKQIPSFMQSYLKKHGAAVGKIEIPITKGFKGRYSVLAENQGHVADFETREAAEAFVENPQNGLRRARIVPFADIPDKLQEVHSASLTPSLKESILGGQPLFAKEEGVAGPFFKYEARGQGNPELEAFLQKEATRLAPGLKVKVAGTLQGVNEKGEKAPFYALYEAQQRLAAVALGPRPAGRAPLFDIHHEVVHDLWNLLRPGEKRALLGKAKEWRKEFNIDARYKSFSEEKKNEEAIAEAFADWQQRPQKYIPEIKGIFEKLLNFLKRLGSFLQGKGFQSAEEVFQKIESEEVGARSRLYEPLPSLSAAKGDPGEATAKDAVSAVWQHNRFMSSWAKMADLHPSLRAGYFTMRKQDKVAHEIVQDAIDDFAPWRELSEKETKEAEEILIESDKAGAQQLAPAESEKIKAAVRSTWKIYDAFYERLAKALEGAAFTKDADGNLLPEFKSHVEAIRNRIGIGYLPHVRDGNRGIVARYEDGSQAAFVTFDTWDALWHFPHLIFNPAAARRAYGTRLQKMIKARFPTATVGEPKFLTQNQLAAQVAQQGDALETLLQHIGTGGGMSESDLKGLFDKIKQEVATKGFKRHLRERSGVWGYYHPDVAGRYVGRSLAKYLNSGANFVARIETTEELADARKEVAATGDPRLIDWYDKAIKFSQSPPGIDAKVRGTMFYWAMGGNIATSLMNLTQLGVGTYTFLLGMGVGPARSAKYLSSALADVVRMVNPLKLSESGINWSKKPDFLSDADWEYLKGTRRSGQTISSVIGDIGGSPGMDIASKGGAKVSKTKTTFLEAMRLPFAMAEQINRMATGLAAFRAASENSQVLGRAETKLRTGRWSTKIGEEGGLTPETFAEAAVSESQFETGAWDRPEAMRMNEVASIATQFLTYPIKMLELWTRLAWQYDKGLFKLGYGKAGLAAMTFFLWGLGGLGAVAPGSDALKEAIEAIYKAVTNKGLNLDTEMRRLLVPLLGPTWTDLALKGPSRAAGLDVSERVKINPWPRMEGGAVGPAATMAFSTFNEAANWWKQDETARMLGAFMFLSGKNVIKGVQAYTQPTGPVSMSGMPLLAKQGGGVRQATLDEALLQSVGFTPTAFARARELIAADKEVLGSKRDLQERWTERGHKLLLGAVVAGRQEEQEERLAQLEKFKELQRMVQEHNKGKPAEDRVQINWDTVRRRVLRDLTMKGGVPTREVPTRFRPALRRLHELFPKEA